MTDLSVVDQIGSADRDPAGFRYSQIESVEANCGAVVYLTPHRPMMGAIVDTGRTLYPGDRVVFRCQGNDPYGRELSWWLHPYNSGRHPQIRGDRVEATWIVQPDSVGDRVYVGVGMAANSRYHRQGGPDEQGYDGWIVFYYRVLPATTGVTSVRSRHRSKAMPEPASTGNPGMMRSRRRVARGDSPTSF